MKINEIIFTITESLDGGYEASAVGHSIYTQSENYNDLPAILRDAVKCHFDEDKTPSIIRMRNSNIILRYIKESDIADYVKWTTTETEWMDWDAPWEDDEDDFVEMQKQNLEKEQNFYSKLEIETIEGEHIGWVSNYDFDFEGEKVTGVGLDIPAPEHRGRGYGGVALAAYMAHLFAKEDVLFTQTWSGNAPMLRLAEKLGFAEVRRIKNLRQVRGEIYDALTFAISKTDFLTNTRNP